MKKLSILFLISMLFLSSCNQNQVDKESAEEAYKAGLTALEIKDYEEVLGQFEKAKELQPDNESYANQIMIT